MGEHIWDEGGGKGARKTWRKLMAWVGLLGFCSVGDPSKTHCCSSSKLGLGSPLWLLHFLASGFRNYFHRGGSGHQSHKREQKLTSGLIGEGFGGRVPVGSYNMTHERLEVMCIVYGSSGRGNVGGVGREGFRRLVGRKGVAAILAIRHSMSEGWCPAWSRDPTWAENTCKKTAQSM